MPSLKGSGRITNEPRMEENQKRLGLIASKSDQHLGKFHPHCVKPFSPE